MARFSALFQKVKLKCRSFSSNSGGDKAILFFARLEDSKKGNTTEALIYIVR